MPNVTVTLEKPLLLAAKAKAKAQCRSLSQHVSFLIMRDISPSPAQPTRKTGRNEPIVTSLTPTRRKASKKEVTA